jgi:NDP-sugar pyrophosphorylase family protein
MKAMVFAAGVGSRLKHLTQTTPKCLMEVGSKTMLSIVLERLKVAGVTEVVINLHHLPQRITDYMDSNSRFGLTVHYSHEDTLLDTGGGLKRVAHLFQTDEPFVVHNSDIYCEVDLPDLIAHHRASGATATLAIRPAEGPRGLYFDSTAGLTGWSEERVPLAGGSSLKNFTGIQIVSRQLFDYMPEDESFSIIVPYLNATRSGQRINGYDIGDAYWLDMGTIEKLEELRKHLAVPSANLDSQ